MPLIDTVDVLLLELLLVLVVDNEADFVFVELAVTVFVLNGLAELVVLSEYEDEGEGFDDWVTDTLPDSDTDTVICAVTDGEEVTLGE